MTIEASSGWKEVGVEATASFSDVACVAPPSLLGVARILEPIKPGTFEYGGYFVVA